MIAVDVKGKVPLTNTSKIVCPQKSCRREFDSADSLLQHRKEGHADRIFKCHYLNCYWDFISKRQLDKHLMHHTMNKPYLCSAEGCNMKFTSQYNLNSHLKQHKLKVMIKCPAIDCDEQFLTERALILHKQLLHNEKLFKCKQCPKAPIFTSFVQWQVHQRTHPVASKSLISALQDFKMYNCKVNDCGAKFVHPYSLREHVNLEHASKVFSCPVLGCERSFVAKSTMKRHLRTHKKDKVFVCENDGCAKTFSRLEHLRRHVSTHQLKFKYVCEVEGCGKIMSSRSNLLCHSGSHVHTEAVVCGVNGCLKQFLTAGNLRHHRKNVHNVDSGVSNMNKNVPLDDGANHDHSASPNGIPTEGMGDANEGKRSSTDLFSKANQTKIALSQIKGPLKTVDGTDASKATSGSDFFVCDIKGCKKKYKSEEKLIKHCAVYHAKRLDKGALTSLDGTPTPPKNQRLEKEVQTDGDMSFSSAIVDTVHPTLEEGSGLLASQDMLPFMTMTPPSVVIDRTLFRQKQLQQNTCRYNLSQMTALETLAHVAVFESSTDNGSTDSDTSSRGSTNNSSFSTPTKQLDSPRNFADLCERIEYIRDEALSDLNIFSIIQKDLECAENIEIPSTEDQSQDCYEQLSLNLESSVTMEGSNPKMDVLIGSDDTLSRQIDGNFHSYFRTSLPLEDPNISKEDEPPKNFHDDDVEVEVVTRCDLDVSMDGVSFNFGSILDHDGYISPGSLYGVLPLSTDR